jgi:hypothetical protein
MLSRNLLVRLFRARDVLCDPSGFGLPIRVSSKAEAQGVVFTTPPTTMAACADACSPTPAAISSRFIS